MTDGPISKIPGYGIKVDLSNYAVRRSREGGVPLWSEQERNIIRASAGQLGQYLADVREFSEENSFVIFKNEVGGNGQPFAEYASQSYPAKFSSIRPSEIAGLHDAFEKFKAQATEKLRQDEPYRWQIISNLKLPNPNVDPQFYRVYGAPYRRRLLVLWGLERRNPTLAGEASLIPEAAIAQLESKKGTFPTWLWWLLPLLLALLLLAALLLAYFDGWACAWFHVGCPVSGVLTMEKTGVITTDSNRSLILYKFVISNTGAGPIRNVNVSDPRIPDLICSFSPLDAHATQICQGNYALTAADLRARRVDNTATVSGIDRNGLRVTANAQSSLPLTGDTPGKIAACCSGTLPSTPPGTGGTTSPGQDAQVPGNPPNSNLGNTPIGNQPLAGNLPPFGNQPPLGNNENPSQPLTPLPESGHNPILGDNHAGTGGGRSGPGVAPVPSPSPLVPGTPQQPGTGSPPGGTNQIPPGGGPGSGERATPGDETPPPPIAAPPTIYSAAVTGQTVNPNGLVDLQVSATASAGGQPIAVRLAQWTVVGNGHRITVSGNPIQLSLPASQTPYQLVLQQPNRENVQKTFDLPIQIQPIHLINR